MHLASYPHAKCGSGCTAQTCFQKEFFPLRKVRKIHKPSSWKPVEQSTKTAYAELTITELIAEDANRWSDKMSSHAAVGGFVTQVAKESDGDTNIRICENPKIEHGLRPLHRGQVHTQDSVRCAAGRQARNSERHHPILRRSWHTLVGNSSRRGNRKITAKLGSPPT